MYFLANRPLLRNYATRRFDTELVGLPSQSEVGREVAASNVMHCHADFEGADTPTATTTDLCDPTRLRAVEPPKLSRVYCGVKRQLCLRPFRRTATWPILTHSCKKVLTPLIPIRAHMGNSADAVLQAARLFPHACRYRHRFSTTAASAPIARASVRMHD